MRSANLLLKGMLKPVKPALRKPQRKARKSAKRVNNLKVLKLI